MCDFNHNFVNGRKEGREEGKKRGRKGGRKEGGMGRDDEGDFNLISII